MLYLGYQKYDFFKSLFQRIYAGLSSPEGFDRKLLLVAYDINEMWYNYTFSHREKLLKALLSGYA